MANYANLLATIAANIYTNNNNEVTAAMVKTAVDQMVASLGAGYQFMGVATPATNPGTPDYKCFYIATEIGTYTNFGGLSLSEDGKMAILKWDSSWSLELLDIRDYTIFNAVFSYAPQDRAGRLSNTDIYGNGEVYTHSNYNLYYFYVAAGKQYRITLYSDGVRVTTCASFSAVPQLADVGVVLSQFSTAETRHVFIAPTSDGFIGIGAYGTFSQYIGVDEIVNNIEKESGDVAQQNDFINSFRDYHRIALSAVSGDYKIDTAGKVVAGANGSKIYYAAVTKGQILHLLAGDQLSHPVLVYGFNAGVPAVDDVLSNVQSVGKVEGVDLYVPCPMDGYIVLNMWYNRTKYLYETEFGSNDYFLRASYLQKIASLRRTFDNDTTEYKTLVLLLGADPHAEMATFQRFMAFGDRYGSYLDDIVVNGDVVASKFGAAGNDLPFDSVPGFEKVLLSIGNHDCYDWNNLAPAGQEYDAAYEATNAQKYARYMKNISEWGVVSAGADLCYYYKDYDTDSSVQIAGEYAKKVRLIVLDSMDTDPAQTTWLQGVLADALANDLHVVCMEHIINNPVSTPVAMECNWSEDFILPTMNRGHEDHLAAVQDFIDGGGVFVCWLYGHTHVYQIGTFEEYPKQLYINLGAIFQNPAWGHRETVRLTDDASFDNFCVFSVDTLRKHVKLLKVGCEFDRDLKHRGTIAFEYGDVPTMIAEF